MKLWGPNDTKLYTPFTWSAPAFRGQTPAAGEMKAPMGPPPPSISSPPPDSNPNPSSEPSSVGTPALDEAEIGARVGAEAEQAGAQAAESSEGKEPPEKPAASESSARPVSKSRGLAVPYAIPPWSEPPGHPFYFEVLKDGSIIEQLDA